MSAILHYTPCGSVNPEWLRESRLIEADCENTVASSFHGTAPAGTASPPAGGPSNEDYPEAAVAYAVAVLLLVMIGSAVMAVLILYGVVR